MRNRIKRLKSLAAFIFAAIFAMFFTTSSTVTVKYRPSDEERANWDKLMQRGIEKIVFVKRFTYDGNHYYTEYLNSNWKPGGNLCVLSLRTGETHDLVPSLNGGVFGSFDISPDARRIVFAYKASKDVGYRIYEVGADGTGLRQVTFSPDDEDAIISKYAIGGYHHGDEDLDPCYLPDGGIAFISTRCRYGILCDAPDIFTTTVLYRIDADGTNLKQLSNSSVSESTPTVLPDGRILYTRWEYVDKGAVSVKCLWAMNPDGTNSSEVFGNDVAYPPTMIMARPIPDSPSEYVFTGTPHCCSQNAVGTVIRIDVSQDVHTRAPMTYISPCTDVRYEHGAEFRDPDDSARWYHDHEGRGQMFRETFPLSRSEFLVAHKPAGPAWNDEKAWQISLLYEGGATSPVYSDKTISCFRPLPLIPRATPPTLPDKTNKQLAQQNLAECIVVDVYRGMENTPRGTIRYLRVLEQVPRPWGARRFYKPNYTQDEYDQQHAVISKDTHLGLKVQYGVVNVEADGSARFLVPAGRNIFLQALDANYRAVQTERTYVNYKPGEVRSCTGCHEAATQSPPIVAGRRTPLAMKRAAETPFAQPGETSAQRTLSYARDVQPVWDRHCIQCHNAVNSPAGLNLSGKETRLFNVSYENLVPERRGQGGGAIADLPAEKRALIGNDSYMGKDNVNVPTNSVNDERYTTEGKGFYANSDGRYYTKVYDRGLLGPVIGENHPKNGNISYLPAKTLGTFASVLAAMLFRDFALENPADRQRAEHLAKVHDKIQLSAEEKLKVSNWIDTNCQYYGTYYGRRDSIFKQHPDYRTEYDFSTALQTEPPASYE
jgi:hypothetical protein